MRHDAIIVGGSFAGLSAALYLVRGRRSVVLLDTGTPRNRLSPHAHGILALDGRPPAEILSAARAQVAAYPTVTMIDRAARAAAREQDGFAVKLATGDVLHAARIVLAFGISDELPDVPGLAERWGRTVLHCPYCHGYEFGDRRLGVLSVSPMSAHQALLIADWGPTTLYLNGSGLDDALRAQLRSRGVSIEAAPVKGLHGDGTDLTAITLEDGRTSPVDALFLGPRTRVTSDIAWALGCEGEDGPFGRFIRTDAQKATSVPGVFAAGDITRSAHNATWASADGVMAAVALHRSLIF